MTIAVLTAVTDPEWEAQIVSGLTSGRHGVEVVRRCVDLADLLAAASAGLGRAAVVSADLRRLDREALTRLAACGTAVIGLAADADTDALARLRRMGVAHVLAPTAPAAEVAATVQTAVGAALPPQRREPQPGDFAGAAGPDSGAEAVASGRLLAVWGPTGAPGRSTVAVTIAAELARAGRTALLVDADVYGGVLAQLLGLLDDSAGLAAACRLANNGVLDLAGLAELALEVAPGLRVLTGISRPQRWPEVRPSALAEVLDLARQLATTVVVDCGFSLEQDEELSFDTAAPRRNGATLTALAAADTVVGVAAADPVGLQRYVRGLTELGDAVPGVRPVTVVNRLRSAVVGGGDARAEITAALERFAGVTDLRFVPLDVDGCDRAVAAGRTLTEAAPSSPARLALRDLAVELGGVERPVRRRRLARAGR